MMEVNPIIGVNNDNKINSGVIHPTIKPCSQGSSSRRKRSAGNANDTVSTSSDLSNLGNVSGLAIGLSVVDRPGTFINGTSYDSYGMLYHIYNLSQPGNLSVQIQVWTYGNVSSLNDTLNVYVLDDAKPIPSNYKWFMHSYWGNVPTGYVTDQNGTLVPVNYTKQILNNYTLFLMPNETFNVTQLFVGVQSTLCKCCSVN